MDEDLSLDNWVLATDALEPTCLMAPGSRFRRAGGGHSLGSYEASSGSVARHAHWIFAFSKRVRWDEIRYGSLAHRSNSPWLPCSQTGG